MKKAAFIDFETTGLDPKKGFITEVAVIQMSYNSEGKLKKVLDQYTSFNDPGEPIPAKITELTGITNDLVKGHKIDWSRVNEILDSSDIIVAHNAPFDKKWAMKHGNIKDTKWACSVAMIEWRNKHGFEKSKLEYLKEQHNIEAPSHRAIDDVRTLIKILKQKQEDKTYFQILLENFDTKLLQISISNTQYKDKDILRNCGFYWQSGVRVWLGLKLESQWMLMEKDLKLKLPHVKISISEAK